MFKLKGRLSLYTLIYMFALSILILLSGCETPKTAEVSSTSKATIPSSTVSSETPKLTAISNCPEKDSPALEAEAKKKETNNSVGKTNVAKLINTRIEFHDAALNPKSYVPQFSKYPLYLLGIEKPRHNSATPYATTTPKIDKNNLKIPKSDRNKIWSALDDSHSMTLTHILSIEQSNSQSKECFIYNVYQDETAASWCQHNHITRIEKGNKKWTSEGWDALNQLGLEIKEVVQREKATHIIVLATGWNTEQYESYRDFDYWMKQLGDDFKNKGDFRPIFVGISWESEWKGLARIPRIGSAMSINNKGNDADEIGFTWVNYLLNDVLKPVAASSNAQPKLVAIGHSYGSRIVLGSHYVRDIIAREPSSSDSYPVTLIGLQAAFPTGRFVLNRGGKHPYNKAYKNPATVVITSSTADKATGMIDMLTTGYIGGKGGLDELLKHKEIYDDVIALPVFDTDSTGQPIQKPSQNKVSVYNATPFVNCQLQGTDSGAHSDVYDPEMGRFLGEIIRKSE